MKKYLISLVLGLALCACAGPRVVILHTNDTHSHFEPLSSGDRNGWGGAIERAAFVDSVRLAEGADRVLLVHAGDFSQGSSYFSELKGDFEPVIINAMKYDVVTFGNHELDNGVEELARRVAMIDPSVQIVCANIDFSEFDVLCDRVKPYAIVNKNGMKIGFIGMEAELGSTLSSSISSRLKILDNVTVVNKWASLLRKQEKCDMVILLSHLGYDVDQLLLPKVSNIDMVIGGHTHTFVQDFLYVNDADGKPVPIITDGQWGLEMGKISVR